MRGLKQALAYEDGKEVKGVRVRQYTKKKLSDDDCIMQAVLENDNASRI
jgi:hypothetical protein